MYRNILDAFALKTLAKMPNIPDFHLMVGSAEEHSPMPLLVYEKSVLPSQLVNNFKVTQNMTNEEIESAIANGQLEVNDLNYNVALIGLGIQEV